MHIRLEKSWLALLTSIVLLAAGAAAQVGPYDEETLAMAEELRALQKSAHDCTATAGNLITNCSFETGDFTGWIVEDMDFPLVPMSVFPGGVGIVFFVTAPTQGSFSLGHGYDGGGPDNILVQQDILATGGECELEFDYRGAWTMFPDAQDRTFDVRLEQPVGTTVFSQNILTSLGGSTVDTGAQSALVSIPAGVAAAGSARLVLDWTIPEFFTGPAQFELDNVQLLCADPDSDGDGVFDDDDLCPGTVVPEGVPTVRLGTNRFALVDGDDVFDTKDPKGNGPGASFTLADTAGCSCEQIIDAQGLGNGHRKFGCSLGAMREWVALVGN